MKFFMEKNKDEGHRVTIHIPKITVNKEIFEKLIKISKKTNINGFRKGKIPIKIVQEKYGETVYYDVFKELMQKFFHEFTKKEKIKIIGFPKYYMHANEDKKKEFLAYSVKYELYPKFSIKNIELIKTTKINVVITENDIKKKIEEYKVKNNIWNTVQKPIRSNDRITINYSIYEKNKRLEKFDAEKIVFILDKNKLLSILNEKIINHFTNDILFFKIHFHQYYPEKELQNKDITFKIKIVKVEKKQSLESNEKKIKNTQEETITQIHYENIKYNLKDQINQITQQCLEQAIIEEIIKKNPIFIPPILFQEEINILYRQQKQQYKKYNNNLLEKKYHIDLNLKAKKRLYNKMILEKIISDNQFLENEENIQKLIQKISLNYEKPIKIINLYNNNTHLKNIIKNIELQKRAMDWLRKKVQITKKNWTFNQFIQYKQENNEELFI